jgi:hypothetical protein
LALARLAKVVAVAGTAIDDDNGVVGARDAKAGQFNALIADASYDAFAAAACISAAYQETLSSGSNAWPCDSPK